MLVILQDQSGIPTADNLQMCNWWGRSAWSSSSTHYYTTKVPCLNPDCVLLKILACTLERSDAAGRVANGTAAVPQIWRGLLLVHQAKVIA